MSSTSRKPIILASGTGRYTMGPIFTPFKNDGAETSVGYSVLEFWLEANARGTGVRSQAEDYVFYVLGGVMSFFIDKEWIDVPKASFVLIPAGVVHDFENRGTVRSGVLNFSSQENFEKYMPDVVAWYR